MEQAYLFAGVEEQELALEVVEAVAAALEREQLAVGQTLEPRVRLLGGEFKEVAPEPRDSGRGDERVSGVDGEAAVRLCVFVVQRRDADLHGLEGVGIRMVEKSLALAVELLRDLLPAAPAVADGCPDQRERQRDAAGGTEDAVGLARQHLDPGEACKQLARGVERQHVDDVRLGADGAQHVGIAGGVENPASRPVGEKRGGRSA